MENKYNFIFSDESVYKNVTRLINQIWKLIPMKENNENWIKQLDTVIIEIAGMNKIFYSSPLFLQILSKLEGLKVKEDIEFFIYRKTIFEIINLLQEIKNA